MTTVEHFATIAGRVLADVVTGQPVTDPRTEGARMTDQPPTRMDLLRQATDLQHYRRLCQEHGIEPVAPPAVVPGSTGLPGAFIGDRSVKVGDRICVLHDHGTKREFVVTSDPRTDTDGKVTFDVADPVMHAAMQRLDALQARLDEADRRDAAKWDALSRHADAAEATGGDVTFEFAPDQPTDADAAVEQLEVHHARGRERTDEEQAKLDELDANLAELRRRRPAAAALHDNHLHVSYATGGIVESGVTGDNPPPWLTGCAYPPPGRGLDLLVERYGADTIARLGGVGGSR